MTSSRRIHLFLAAILVATSSATARAADLRQIWEKFRERQQAAEAARVAFATAVLGAALLVWRRMAAA